MLQSSIELATSNETIVVVATPSATFTQTVNLGPTDIAISAIEVGFGFSQVVPVLNDGITPTIVTIPSDTFRDIDISLLNGNGSPGAVLNPFILKLVNVSSVNGAVLLPARSADAFEIILTENVTNVTIDGWPPAGKSQRTVLYLKQDNVGGRTFGGWPSNFYVTDGLPLVITPTPNALDIFVLSSLDAGATILVDQVGANYLPIGT